MVRETLLMKELENRGSRFFHIILDVYSDIESLLNHRIAQVFPSYTQHDVGHSTRIMGHIYKLIPNIKELNELEISILILSALLHDIGMAASDEEIHKIKTEEINYKEIKYTSLLKKFDGNENEALQEYIRKVHAERSSNFIMANLQNKLLIPEMPNKSFAEIVAQICRAHTQDIFWVKNNLQSDYIIGDFKLKPQFYALLLRLGDILDFDSLRTPYRLYTAINPKGYSKEEWQQHFIIDNSDKITANSIGEKSICFYGKCKNPNIYRKVLRYIDWINHEIINSIEITKEFDQFHRLNIYHSVKNNITSEGYSFVDLRFEMNYQNTLGLLIGENLYGDKKSGLRELIQNSLDACLILKEIKMRSEDTKYEDYQPKIYIILDEKNNIVKIKDNGKGMNIYELKNHFLTVGSSYFNSEEYLLSEYNYKSIGKYGIGFLTGFMLSNTITIRTKGYREDKLLEVDVHKDNEYVSIKELKKLDFKGTEIILDYTEFFKVFKDDKEVYNYINGNFIENECKIYIDANGILSEVKTETMKTETVIDLSRYLKEIDAKLYLSKTVESPFIKYLNELKSGRVDFAYNGKQVHDATKENVLIKDYISNNIMNYISFMVVNDSNDLDELIEIEQHIDDIEQHYRDNYQDGDIDIAISPNLKLPNYKGDLIKDNEIISGLEFDDLDKFDDYYHDNSSGTYISIYKFNFFGIDGVDKYLQISARGGSIETSIYVRNVFVEDSNISVKKCAILKYLNKAKLFVNIINNNIVPDLSRTKLLFSDKELISNSIYQALYLFLLEDTADATEKLILRNYIKQYHNYQNTLLKDEHINQIKQF
ncbi:HD domain-containing protein [Paenibacillus maysiensis]|uniref:HD domain-containing protein n=1 Tax=Paenibacillus maysiensis TaxID=1155954 RepID=UPI000471E8E4|nr:ATP-binding protein [Paenibacillus maysiensis]